jgi:uridine phosphorylase
VWKKSQFFDSIEFSTQKENSKPKRNFQRKAYYRDVYRNWSDNIDIVINELDALVNIDLETRQPKENLTS